jgi:hypothetical protein
MKKVVVSFSHVRSSMAGGILLAGLVLIFSLTSKFLSIFDGIVGIFMNLFSEFGYDLNFFGILIGIICGFIFGFIINYLYNLVFWNILKR